MLSPAELADTELAAMPSRLSEVDVAMMTCELASSVTMSPIAIVWLAAVS